MASEQRKQARPHGQFATTVGSLEPVTDSPGTFKRRPYEGIISGAVSSCRESSDLITGALQRGHQPFLNRLEEPRQ
jgi:hypothetical protein